MVNFGQAAKTCVRRRHGGAYSRSGITRQQSSMKARGLDTLPREADQRAGMHVILQGC